MRRRDIYDIKLKDIFDKIPRGKVGKPNYEEIMGHRSTNDLIKDLDLFFQNINNLTQAWASFRNDGKHTTVYTIIKAVRELRYSFRDPIMALAVLKKRLMDETQTGRPISIAFIKKKNKKLDEFREILNNFDLDESMWNGDFKYKRYDRDNTIKKKRK